MKRYNTGLKACAFLLAAACFAFGMWAFAGNSAWLFREYEEADAFAYTHYTETRSFQRDLNHVLNVVEDLAVLPDRASIENGETVDKEQIEQATQALFQDKRWYIEQQLAKQIPQPDIYTLSDVDLWRAFEREYAEEIKALPARIIAEELAHYDSLLAQLSDRPELTYYIRTNRGTLSNQGYVPDDSLPAHASLPYAYQGYRQGCAVVYAAGYIDAKDADFQAYAAAARILLGTLAALLAVCLLCFGYLLYAVGRKTADGRVYTLFIDKVYGEFILLFLLLVGAAVVWLADRNIRYAINAPYLWLTAFFISGVLGLSLLLSLVRRCKNRTILSQTMLYVLLIQLGRLIRKFFTWIRSLYGAGSLMHKTMGAIAVFGLMCMIPFASFILIPTAIWFMARKVRVFQRIQEGVTAIQNGEYDQKIETDGQGEFAALAASLHEIAAGLNTEVERRLKAERLKTELISNVSHDIRTPLTSVITYVDLLKSESADHENIRKYVEVIDQKANRLKQLMDDLFEASKAASGSIPVSWEKVDIASLLTQGLGELDDKVKASALDFRVQAPSEKLYVRADGRLLWRVMENLLANVFKYALSGSRVYIRFFTENGMAGVEMKNISAYELNVDESELMERFKRGDEARSDPGSGLGLAIAKSLMLAQNGRLGIQIDGDLFKATVLIPLWHD